MRAEFFERFKPSQQEFDELWNGATFVFDTNFLLNFYGYSKEARTELFTLLHSIKTRVWLPRHVAIEYFARRVSKILEQHSRYDEPTRILKSLKQSLESTNQHPFVSPELMAEFGQTHDKINAEFEASKNELGSLLKNDEIQSQIADIFDGRIGPGLAQTEFEKIIAEGANRYANKIPPGYEDDNKPAPQKFGDLIIWSEVLEFAKSQRKSVILVTNDSSDDWWERAGSSSIGPRPELLREFANYSGQRCYLYLPHLFIAFASQKFENVSPATVSQVREVVKTSHERDEAQRRERDSVRLEDVAFFRKALDDLRRQQDLMKDLKPNFPDQFIFDELRRKQDLMKDLKLNLLDPDVLDELRRQQALTKDLMPTLPHQAILDDLRRQQALTKDLMPTFPQQAILDDLHRQQALTKDLMPTLPHQQILDAIRWQQDLTRNLKPHLPHQEILDAMRRQQDLVSGSQALTGRKPSVPSEEDFDGEPEKDVDKTEPTIDKHDTDPFPESEARSVETGTGPEINTI